MKIILSPAKKMRMDADCICPTSRPVFLERAAEILRWMQSLSYVEAKKVWACSDKIAEENYARLQEMDLQDEAQLTPAILSYDGIAFQYMAPSVFEDEQFEYVQEHLRILSGFYGVLKPMDGVISYRLEMGAKIGSIASHADVRAAKSPLLSENQDLAVYPQLADGQYFSESSNPSVSNKLSSNLYDYWGDSLYREVRDDSGLIINLASKEYSLCIERYLQPGDRFITCVFGEFADPEQKKIVQKGVYAKMARGDMVRFMAEQTIEEPERLKEYGRMGYHFSDERSTENEYVFIRETRGIAD